MFHQNPIVFFLMLVLLACQLDFSAVFYLFAEEKNEVLRTKVLKQKEDNSCRELSLSNPLKRALFADHVLSRFFYFNTFSGHLTLSEQFYISKIFNHSPPLIIG